MGKSLWTATLLLVRLEYELASGQQLLGGVCPIKNSVTYQASLGEGRE